MYAAPTARHDRGHDRAGGTAGGAAAGPARIGDRTPATAMDVQRVVGGGDRQARRLLAAAIAETVSRTRPHVVSEEA